MSVSPLRNKNAELKRLFTMKKKTFFQFASFAVCIPCILCMVCMGLSGTCTCRTV